jgi:magnesium chelatase subunit D
MPSPEQDEAPDQQEPETPPEPQQTDSVQTLEDKILDAEKAALPPELLASLSAGLGPRRTARGGGKSGVTASLTRGPPVSGAGI